MSALSDPQIIASPFDPELDALYRQWRDLKLEGYPTSLGDIVVEVKDPRELTTLEHAALLARCRKANMAVYVSATGDDPDPAIPLSLARRMGISGLNKNWLADDSGLTSLTVVNEGTRQNYIPYSNKPIQWHTDGYYNTADRQIHSLNLHCVSPAAKGGENQLLDHEIAYILLRDENPDYIRALMAPDAMTIPARFDREGKVARAEETGPVFSFDPQTANLHMRYTVRKTNIIWKDDELTSRALACLTSILAGETPYIYSGRLESGMGLVSSNILHDRTGFSDDDKHKRLIYRARYFDRLKDTDVLDIYPGLRG